MEYSEFCDILNKQIFDCSKRKLLEKIASEPHRFIGLFRPTKPRAKVLQNLLHSHEIRFGDALEIIFQKYYEQIGYTNLPKKIEIEGTYLSLDQLFKDENSVYFIEQKVRDDHDSTKKTGQNVNFEDKIGYLVDLYGEYRLKCFIYFIDPAMKKNKRTYLRKVERINQEYNASVWIVYGKELWDILGHPSIWDELLEYLERWRETIPEIPSINFDDDDLEDTFDEIKNIGSSTYKKLLSNKDICENLFPILFPENKMLMKLREYFRSKEDSPTINNTLVRLIDEYLSHNISSTIYFK